MIVYPLTWKAVNVTADRCYAQLLEIVKTVPCNNLALSGGIDSSLMLKALIETSHENIVCYTIALNSEHPDAIFSKLITRQWDIPHIIKYPTQTEQVYQTFFSSIEVDSIICCDGIDEYMCGYYDHSKYPTEKMYRYYLSRLVPDHLEILNEESEEVRVYLPYLDDRLTGLMSRIPLDEKVKYREQRKIVVQQMARIAGVPEEIISRRKYGFCDIWVIKGVS